MELSIVSQQTHMIFFSPVNRGEIGWLIFIIFQESYMSGSTPNYWDYLELQSLLNIQGGLEKDEKPWLPMSYILSLHIRL